MIVWTYNTLLILSFPVMLPYFLMKHRKAWRLGERLGSGWVNRRTQKDRPIWFHAASVGEVQMTLPLIHAVKKRRPTHSLSVSTMTEAGQEAAKRLQGEGITTFFFPLDLPWVVRRVLDGMAPRALFIAETEIWPNLLHECHRRGIPVVLYNGRISDRSFRNYRRFRFFFKVILRAVSALGMQSERDAERIVEIGAIPERVVVTGNLKFDRPARYPTETEIRRVRDSLGLRAEQPVFVAGSTHRGEEEILLTVYRQLKSVEPSIVLVLAPRHLDRLAEVIKLLEEVGFKWMRKSQIPHEGFSGEVILLDTMGELEAIYSVGTVVFVGKSLVPGGGHNILEPASFGKPAIFGPHMENFREIATIMKEAGGGIEVRGEDDLFQVALKLLTDRSYYSQKSQAALCAIEKNQGAIQKTVQILERYLT